MSENSSVWLMFVFVRNQCKIKLLVSCELLVETKYHYILINYIVTIPTWGWLCRHGRWLASRRYRDTEGLIVQSSTASTLSALCSMCTMLAGLHTVVCAQTNLVGRGERRRLVKYWLFVGRMGSRFVWEFRKHGQLRHPRNHTFKTMAILSIRLRGVTTRPLEYGIL